MPDSAEASARMREVLELGEALHGLSPSDPLYHEVLQRLDHVWRSLSFAEQDEVDRLVGLRSTNSPKT